MAKAIDVARYLIQLAASEDEPEILSHLRLQKLLYYVQGWSLALRDREMFPEQIQAWAHGPVVRSLYSVFADYGYQPIPPEHFADTAAEISQDEAEFIDSVWEAYRGFSAMHLREMTHSESPWLDARGGIPPTASCSTEITREAMKAFFSSQADQR